MTEPDLAHGVHPMITLDCPWCAAPAHVDDEGPGLRFVCPECAVSAEIAPEPLVELPVAA